jgi:hypothetical protein
MRVLQSILVGLSLLVLTARPARSDAIQYSAANFTGIPGGASLSAALPDLTTGGAVTLNNSAGFLPAPDPTKSYPNPPTVQTINDPFKFVIGVAGPAPAPGTSPAVFNGNWMVSVEGNLKGNIVGPFGSPPDYTGGFIGTASSVSITSTQTGPLPPPLQNLVDHPNRIHISGSVTPGSGGVINTTLMLEPAAVPEPTTLAFFFLAGGGLVLLRRRGTRGPSATNAI